jgi:HEPN domain-containing protein
VTIDEHVDYWIKSAEHDLDTAESLYTAGKYDWCLFIGHLVLEKMIKAIFVIAHDNKVPPKIHNLVKLAELASIKLTLEQKIFLDEVNDFNLETRYPDFNFEFYKICTATYTKKYLDLIKEFYSWLKSQLV